VPNEVLSSIAATANAPVYVFLDQYVGLGAVGGNVYSFDTHAHHVADLGLKILAGATPASLPVIAPVVQVDMFDARQLERWKLDEARLPPGSVVRNRDPGAWTLYRPYIIVTIAVVVMQGALIAGLLLARRRQRQAEAQARRQRDELAHVLRVTTLSELTSELAHEISQPIGAIQLNAQAAMLTLSAGPPADTKALESALADIVATTDYVTLVVRRLRKLFRKERAEYVAVDVKALIDEVVRLLRAAMLVERIDIRVELGEALPMAFGESVQLQQVLLNVVRNACDAIGTIEDGAREITIRARQDRSGHVVIEVSDTGAGVAAAELERMFEPFVSTKPDGLGMGLAISRSIIDAHGGLIWASANPDRGLTMHIELVAWLTEARSVARAPVEYQPTGSTTTAVP
jgi:signal transduction histidine kinase